jgi:hypothetical protein
MLGKRACPAQTCPLQRTSQRSKSCMLWPRSHRARVNLARLNLLSMWSDPLGRMMYDSRRVLTVRNTGESQLGALGRQWRLCSRHSGPLALAGLSLAEAHRFLFHYRRLLSLGLLVATLEGSCLQGHSAETVQLICVKFPSSRNITPARSRAQIVLSNQQRLKSPKRIHS